MWRPALPDFDRYGTPTVDPRNFRASEPAGTCGRRHRFAIPSHRQPIRGHCFAVPSARRRSVHPLRRIRTAKSGAGSRGVRSGSARRAHSTAAEPLLTPDRAIRRLTKSASFAADVKGASPVLARVVVRVDMRDIEVALELPHHLHERRIVGAVKLDGKLIDPIEQIVRRGPQGGPLGTFHIDLHDQMAARIAVAPNLGRPGCRSGARRSFQSSANTLLVKQEQPRPHAGRVRLKQSTRGPGSATAARRRSPIRHGRRSRTSRRSCASPIRFSHIR